MIEETPRVDSFGTTGVPGRRDPTSNRHNWRSLIGQTAIQTTRTRRLRVKGATQAAKFLSAFRKTTWETPRPGTRSSRSNPRHVGQTLGRFDDSVTTVTTARSCQHFPMMTPSLIIASRNRAPWKPVPGSHRPMDLPSRLPRLLLVPARSSDTDFRRDRNSDSVHRSWPRTTQHPLFEGFLPGLSFADFFHAIDCAHLDFDIANFV